MRETSSFCGRCGAPLEASEAAGNCPACLLETALLRDAGPSSSDSKPHPDEIGAYQILEEAGRGATSIVYRARDSRVGRTVALKVLRGSALKNLEAFERFRTEATAAGRLQHPNIVPLYEMGRQGGSEFLALPFFSQGSLADAIKKARPPLKDAVGLMITVARAVHHAHQHGVLHRDLKPSNILLDADRQPHISDFGLAKISGESADLTLSASVLGTPAYMAPEQASGKARQATQAADVYSLGAILFELIAGRPVFVGGSALEVIRQVADAEPIAPSRLNSAVDSDLEAICLRAIEKEPRDRYASAAEFADDLERWLRTEPTLARPGTNIERAAKWVRRRPVVAALSMALLLALVAGLGGIIWQWRRVEREREATARENYAANMSIAGQRLVQGDIFAVRELLVQQPERFRGWEWGRLMAESFPELLHLRLSAGMEDLKLQIPTPWHKISEDGSMLVIWGLQGRTRVVATRDGSTVLEITNSSGGAAFSPDSRYLFSGGPESGFTMRDTKTGRLLWNFDDASNSDRRMAVNPKLPYVLTTSRTNYARLWNFKERRLVREFPCDSEHAGPQFSPDGTRLWFVPDTPSPPRNVWETATGSLIASVPEHGEFPRCRIIDGNWYITGDSNGVAALWKIGEEKPRFQTPPYGERAIFWIGFSPASKSLGVACSRGEMEFWDVTNGRKLGASLTCVSTVLSVSDEFILTTGGDRLIRRWNWRGKEVGRVACGYAVGAPISDATRDGRFFTAAWQLATGIPALQMWHWPGGDFKAQYPAFPNTGALTADGKTLAVGHSDGRLTLWDAESGRRTAFLNGHWRNVMSLGWNAEGTRLYSGSLDHTIRIWDARFCQETARLTNHTAGVLRLALSGDGKKLAAADHGGWLKVYETDRFKELQSWRPITNIYLWSITLNGDGRYLVAGEAFRQHGVWDTVTGKKVSILSDFPSKDEKNSLLSAVFTPDDRELLTCDYLGNLQFWECGTWRLLRSAKARGPAPAMAFTPDGARVLLAVSDTPSPTSGSASVEVHDGRTGRHITSLGIEPGFSASLSMSGERFARSLACSQEGNARVDVWNSFPIAPPANARNSAEAQLAYFEAFARTQRWSHASVAPLSDAKDDGWVEPRANWQSRDPATPAECVDLTPSYNSHLETGWEPFLHVWEADYHLAALPQGLVRLDGVNWDIRGLICLAREPVTPLEKWHCGSTVEGIQVGRRCRRLHFLHAYGMDTGGSRKIAHYQLHFANGSSSELPLTTGKDLGDWWSASGWSHASEGSMAWEGETPGASRTGSKVRLFHRAFDNPRPDQEIVSFDFVSDTRKTVPFLVALTLE